MIYIYALIDPFTKEIRYIGKSVNPKNRLSAHLADKSKTWRTNWIQSVLKKGKRPELLILESLQDHEDWQQLEKEWIQKGKDKGWNLTNCTEGGDGLCNPPDEVRKKMLKTWTGRKHSKETKKKIGLTSKGRKHSEKWKKNMSKTMKNRKITWGEKLSRANAKLTLEQAMEIRELIKEGFSQRQIAAMFGVHQKTISNINRNVSVAYETPENKN